MLDRDYPQRLAELMAAAECRIALPGDWESVQARRGAQKPRVDERRRFVRFWFPCPCLLELKQTLHTVPREHTYFRAWARDVSRGGVSVLHSEQLYPEEHVRLWLTSSRLQCVVRRCKRHNASCYEIGLEIQRIESGKAEDSELPGAVGSAAGR
jgi:PilZ domain